MPRFHDQETAGADQGPQRPDHGDAGGPDGSVHLSAYRIALPLKARRQSVDHILRRPHVAAMVEDFRKWLRADQLLRDWSPDQWRLENRAFWYQYGQSWATVKTLYQLETTEPERAALREMLATC